MATRPRASLFVMGIGAVLAMAEPPDAHAQTPPEETNNGAATAAPAPADSPEASQAAPPSSAPNHEAAAPAELPNVEVIQAPQKVVRPPARKKAAGRARGKTVVKQQAAPPQQAPIEPSIPSPDAVEAAARNPRQQTNSAAGAYSSIQNYVAEGSGLGTKTGTPLKETPQSITVVGKEQMRDQGVQNLQEALRYTPGILADGFGYDSRGDYSIIRGIEAAYYLDGLRTSYGYYVNTSAIEPYALDRVEVLRGPSSMLYGQAPTGGIINGSSKLPVDIAYNEIGIEYGSFDYKQVRFDSTGRLSSDGKWLYRMTGLVRDAETYVDYVDNDRLMIQPSLTYRPTSDTSITLLGNVRRDRSGSSQQFFPQVGTLSPNANGLTVPRHTFAGEPDDYYNTDQQSASLYVDHRFSDDLKLHHASRFTNTENGYKSTYAAIMTNARLAYLNSFLSGILDPSLTGPYLNTDQTEIGRAVLLQESHTQIFSTDTNLTGTFSTGLLHHKITGGVDYMRFGASQSTAPLAIDNLLTPSTVTPFGQAVLNFYGVGLQPAFDIFNPRYGQSTYYLSTGASQFITPDQLQTIDRPHEVQSQAGIYLQDQLRAGPWIAILGLRQDWLNIQSAGSPDENDRATTGRAALMYEFDNGVTPYVSYSTSFNPLPGQPVGPTIFTPLADLTPAEAKTGEQIEIGIKYQPKSLPFMISAAVYDLSEKNQLAQPDILFQAVQGADISVRGFEIEAAGALTREIKIVASYSYTDATWDKYPSIYGPGIDISTYMEGKPIDAFPKNMASLWAIYTFQTGALRGLSFGGGVRYIGEGESYGLDVFDPAGPRPLYVKTPSYALFDAMVAYETPEWRWQLTAQNLEDQYYVTSCSAYRGDCGLGAPRTLLTSFTYKF